METKSIGEHRHAQGALMAMETKDNLPGFSSESSSRIANSSIALLSLISLALLFGCSAVVVPQEDIMNETELSLHNYSAPGNYICTPLPGVTPCYCMTCRNETSWWALGSLFDGTLIGGECKFKECNLDDYNATVASSSDSEWMRVVSYGMGPGFASSDFANRFCNYTLQTAPKWMIGRGGNPPPMPSEEINVEAAECWLERNILPVYMYYTEGRAISPLWTGQIAAHFHDSGPVIITTEINPNSSDMGNVTAVKMQLQQIKVNCPDCLSVLAVKMGDTNMTEQVLRSYFGGSPPFYESPDWTYVDMVGFGFRSTDYKDCDYKKIIYDAINFSRFILANYSKPTIWLYAGISEGNSSNGSCNLSVQDLHQFYKDMFLLAPGLASSGVVAVNFYEIVDRTGPLPCNGVQGCTFGLYYANGSQKLPQMGTWSNLCKAYGTNARNPLIFSRNAEGQLCSIDENNIKADIGTDLNYQLSYAPALKEIKDNVYYCGEICTSDHPLPRPQIYDDAPSVNFNPANCEIYPQIEIYTEDREISGLYFRATLQQESGFDPLIASCVPIAKASCNTGRPTTPSDLRNYYHLDELCDFAGAEDCHTIYGQYEFNCPAGQKPCGLGLAQCIEYPGKVYVDNGAQIPDEIVNCSGETYNPFNPSDSICCGTGKYNSYFGLATQKLHDNMAILQACPGNMTNEEFDWAAYYLASLYYNAGPESTLIPTIPAFNAQQKNSSGDCVGNPHYIDYINGMAPQLANYGQQVMTRYLHGVGNCNSKCEGVA